MQDKIPVDFVEEAERIVNDYANKTRAYQPRVVIEKKKTKKKRGLNFILSMLMYLGCTLIALALMWGFN